ncbi:MAG: agmatinase [Pirellulales bacterium]
MFTSHASGAQGPSGGGTSPPSYAPSGLGPELNFLGLPTELSDPRTAPAVVLSVPFERTSSFGRGSAGGPAAILEASRQMELFDAAFECEPAVAFGGIATLPPLEFSDSATGEQVSGALEDQVASLLEHEKFVVTLGGEHTSVVGAIRACARRFSELTVLQLDAHADLRPAYEGDAWSHACAMARVLDVPCKLVQVGIRSQEKGEWERARRDKIPILYASQIVRPGGAASDWVERVLAHCTGQVYVTLDCDCLDPAIMPTVGTPEPGGLDWYDTLALVAAVTRGRELVGLDVSELAPVPGLHGPPFTAAKFIYRTLSHRFLAPTGERTTG